jgi:hypothetical protein
LISLALSNHKPLVIAQFVEIVIVIYTLQESFTSSINWAYAFDIVEKGQPEFAEEGSDSFGGDTAKPRWFGSSLKKNRGKPKRTSPASPCFPSEH